MLQHARRPRAASLCDLGAGCGVLGLTLLLRLPTATLHAVELQPRLAELVRRNAATNALDARVTVAEVDVADARAVKAALPGARHHLVVSNPPYQPIGRGHLNPDGEQAVARHEVRLPLARLCAEASRLLRPDGQAALVYPASRIDDLVDAARSCRLALRVLQPVAGRGGEPATRVLALFDKARPTGKVVLLPPLVEHEADGSPTPALRRATEG